MYDTIYYVNNKYSYSSSWWLYIAMYNTIVQTHVHHTEHKKTTTTYITYNHHVHRTTVQVVAFIYIVCTLVNAWLVEEKHQGNVIVCDRVICIISIFRIIDS